MYVMKIKAIDKRNQGDAVEILIYNPVNVTVYTQSKMIIVGDAKIPYLSYTYFQN